MNKYFSVTGLKAASCIFPMTVSLLVHAFQSPSNVGKACCEVPLWVVHWRCIARWETASVKADFIDKF